MRTGVIIRGKGPREGFPDYIVKKFGSDKFGIFHGLVVRHHKIGNANQRIDPKWGSILYAPDPGWSIPCVDVDGDVRDGMYVAQFRYEGLPEGKFEPTDDQKTFHISGTRADEAAVHHKDYEKLVRHFGWDPDKEYFLEYAPDSGAPSGLKVGPTLGQRSPLAFIKGFVSFGIVYRITYASKTIPAIIGKVGTIIKSPPNIARFRLPAGSKERNWLITEPDIDQRGSSAQVTESYELGLWKPQLYGASTLIN